MKAVLVKKPGGPEELEIGDTALPIPKENEVLVKVHAAALNRADILQSEGKYPPPKGQAIFWDLRLQEIFSLVGKTLNAGKKEIRFLVCCRAEATPNMP